MQTKLLVKASIEDGSRRTLWFSNVRTLPESQDEKTEEKRSCRKFMFAGQIKPTKGIFEIIEAGERFGPEIEVNVYGQFFPGSTQNDFNNLKRVKYRQHIPSENIISVMKEHDALLLPTFFPLEGYPGVIIEAYFAGIPVICTDWMALPEIVDDTSGILVPPRDGKALYNAMKKLTEDDSFYMSLREGARKNRLRFSADYWGDYFVEICRNLHADSFDSLEIID